jgi:DNA-binding NarL/FixJ family response regulator
VRIAIVDDTPDVRLVVRLLLELDPELEVVAEAADGQGAIDIAVREHPDVMLLDLSMPVMNGLEALPHVLEASPSTAVLVFSGFRASALEHQAVAAGAVGYLQKGLPAEELRSRVREAGAFYRVDTGLPDSA